MAIRFAFRSAAFLRPASQSTARWASTGIRGTEIVDEFDDDGIYAPRVLGAGRSSSTGITATVFGATGQIGRYVVNNLGKMGCEVIVPFRGEEGGWKHLKVMGDIGQICAIPIDIRQPETLYHAMAQSNVVINLLGRDTDTRNFTLKEIHVDAPQLIAAIAKELKVRNFVHVSSLAASPDAQSAWNRTKYWGEEAVRSEFPEATIIRSGPTFGPYDRYTVPIASMMRFWPLVPIFNPSREVQPIYGPDLASVITTALTGYHVKGRTFNVGGPVVYEEGDLFNVISDLLTIEPSYLELDQKLGTYLSKAFQYWREPPFTADLIARRFDGPEVVQGGLGIEDLGIKPASLRSLDNIGYKYLQTFQEQKNRFVV